MPTNPDMNVKPKSSTTLLVVVLVALIVLAVAINPAILFVLPFAALAVGFVMRSAPRGSNRRAVANRVIAFGLIGLAIWPVAVAYTSGGTASVATHVTRQVVATPPVSSHQP